LPDSPQSTETEEILKRFIALSFSDQATVLIGFLSHLDGLSSTYADRHLYRALVSLDRVKYALAGLVDSLQSISDSRKL